MKKELAKIFVDEVFSAKTRDKSYPNKKIIYNHIDEIWSIDLAAMVDYKNSNNKRFRYIIIIIDKCTKYTWAIALKIKNSQKITQEFSNILTTLKRKPLKLERDRGKEWYNSIFQNFLKLKNIHRYSRFTDKGPSVAEGVIRNVRTFLKKPIFLAGNAEWLGELPSVVKKYNNTIHNSIKETPIPTSKKVNEKIVFSNLHD